MEMERNYDLSKVRKNPYAEKLHYAETVVLDTKVVNYFKDDAQRKGIYYGELISDVLKDYIKNSEQLSQ